MNAAIVGASGYGGEILVKLLAAHPKVTLKAVTSRSKAGQPVSAVIPAMRGALDDMLFEASDPQELAAREDIDVYFLALPHGAAAEYARHLVDAGKKVIDLSADFRISDPAIYEEFYGAPHPDVELLGRSVYVLPELTEDGWQEKDLFACPGCYPTSILIPLLPLLKAGVVSKQHIVANAYSGTSGAGKQSKEAFSFCEVNESVKAYGLPKHRHLSEIEEQLGMAAREKIVIQFNPHLAPMNRGIATTITVPSNGASIEQLYEVWNATYADKPFVFVLPQDQRPETKYVVGTNRVDISAVKDDRTGNFVITSAEDNLVKGASGQAIQILNLWQGWDETAGLV
ncbi:N-acetyl-gamma-glutamyl-phosphate reductase [Pelagicoccus sp. SDUM812003]|uniref:N-acetyl-gamma-glutamyl-phosphate reductase n=1 Tax=Pelagicoccus sp. SDUM812003 TaxID=3041267 RepID=UPI00280EC18D|nr:N-acetyl-gamma-glutamyl-phosphate reductase [Pelagicoccus sp. SDUM812003]MDQ8204196.1 N-acetyl-gamma-glutamyl-phosphate reductase [Pelagicoccus sp. SDUM812003]